MLTERSLFLSCFIALAICIQPALAQKYLKEWQVFEVVLTAKGKYANPYSELTVNNHENGLVKAEFTGISGDAKGKAITVFGFWNGGQTWKVRFAAPESGTWEFRPYQLTKV